jgi:hypothetical protein
MNRDTEKKLESEIRQSKIKKGLTPKPYVKPRLIELGDLRSLTLGASPGLFESGPPGDTRFDNGIGG